MSKALLEIENLDLVFPLQHFRTTSARDFFISAVKAPWNFVTSQRRTLPILKNISFKINRGDRIALMGINGSGKTSLCRCITGSLEPSRGIIKKHVKPRAVIQTEATFYPELTGRENAELLSNFMYDDLTSEDRRQLTAEVIEFSGLGSFADSPVDTYSLGMKTRLSLALTTAKPSDLLILDEVYNHADEFFQKKVEDRVKNQIAGSGAVLLISHYEKDILEFCNRGIVLHQGEILCDSTVKVALKTYRFMNGVNYGEAIL